MGKKCCDSSSSSCNNDSVCTNKCSEPSNTSSSQFKKLYLMLSHWSAVAMGNSELHSVLMIDHSGNHTHDYSGNTSTNGEHSHGFYDNDEGGGGNDNTNNSGSHNHDYSGTTSENGLHRHTFSRRVRNPITRDGTEVSVPCAIKNDTNSITAFNFIWSHRNLLIERCGKNQVWGWVVDFSNGDLRLLQDMDGVSYTDSKTRNEIYETAYNELTFADKKTKSVLDRLYSMSEDIVSCHKYPDTEGELVEMTDKCGQKWLVAVNLAKPNSNTDYTNCLNDGEEEPENTNVFTRVETSKYVFVAIKL